MKILCSACLLGCPCRYDGKDCYSSKVVRLCEEHELIPICPETMGGLDTPRKPCEIQGTRVLNSAGEDLTDAFEKGIAQTMEIVRTLKPDLAILTQRSPSCGSGLIYDGSFRSRLIEGDGMLVRTLKKAGIPVLSSDSINLENTDLTRQHHTKQ